MLVKNLKFNSGIIESEVPCNTKNITLKRVDSILRHIYKRALARMDIFDRMLYFKDPVNMDTKVFLTDASEIAGLRDVVKISHYGNSMICIVISKNKIHIDDAIYEVVYDHVNLYILDNVKGRVLAQTLNQLGMGKYLNFETEEDLDINISDELLDELEIEHDSIKQEKKKVKKNKCISLNAIINILLSIVVIGLLIFIYILSKEEWFINVINTF